MELEKQVTLFGADIAWAPYFFVLAGAALQIVALVAVSKGWF